VDLEVAKWNLPARRVSWLVACSELKLAARSADLPANSSTSARSQRTAQAARPSLCDESRSTLPASSSIASLIPSLVIKGTRQSSESRAARVVLPLAGGPVTMTSGVARAPIGLDRRLCPRVTFPNAGPGEGCFPRVLRVVTYGGGASWWDSERDQAAARVPVRRVGAQNSDQADLVEPGSSCGCRDRSSQAQSSQASLPHEIVSQRSGGQGEAKRCSSGCRLKHDRAAHYLREIVGKRESQTASRGYRPVDPIEAVEDRRLLLCRDGAASRPLIFD
jgi:hypothetical protein